MSESRTQISPETANGHHMPALERLRLQYSPPVSKSAQEETPLNFTEAANSVMSNGVDRHDSISARLTKKFGLGRDPKRRRELFHRLQLLVSKHGDVAYDVINECVADAVGKEKPAHWFCKAVLSRLRDRSLLTVSVGGDPTW